MTMKQEFMKRILDILLSILLLLIFIPIFLITAIFIKLFDKGPIFYSQTRVGLNGKEFTMYKFRSMIINADCIKNELNNDVDGPVFKVKKDPRITKIGRLTRRWSLDEIPQFYNVLKGEMSMVGPRPLSFEEMDGFEQWKKIRLSVLPGITGFWQIEARDHKKFEDWIFYDTEYVKNWSITTDLKILLKTVLVVLRGKGAF